MQIGLDEYKGCWAVNVRANFHLLRAASKYFNANPDGGPFLISSSSAAITPSGRAMAYSVTKAAGWHLMRCLAQTQGPKIRVNATLPGLMLTNWGNRFGAERIEKMKEMAALKDYVGFFSSFFSSFFPLPFSFSLLFHSWFSGMRIADAGGGVFVRR